MTTSQLSIYNGASRILGERRLASLTEDRKIRRVLDDIWSDGFRDLVLSEGLWNFAIRTQMINYTSDIEPDFGLTRAFDKPSDFIRTVALSGDDRFDIPLMQCYPEQRYWFADIDVIYVRYVSNDASYGGDLSLWPINVVRFAQALLAFEACEPLTQSAGKKRDIEAIKDDWLRKARSMDAMDDPVQFFPSGTWASAAAGRRAPSTRYGSGRRF